jgi:predicted ribosomally synthesized peptide with nif11-like leader
MSIESAKACIARMKTDEDFASKVIERKDADARIAFVKAEGFELSVAELEAFVGTLSETELEAVVGGLNPAQLQQKHHILR